MSSIKWKKFFVESGLPSEACENYAVIFAENRIAFDMLNELNKEILYDMGIKKMGDVISILRHAKEVHSSSYRQQLFAKDEDSETAKNKTQADANSTYTKADSTISNDNLNRKSTETNESRRVIMPKRREFNRVVAPPSTSASKASTTSSTFLAAKLIRSPIVAPQEPIVIRNVTGISSSVTNRLGSGGSIRTVTGLDSSSSSSIIRKRIQAPDEEANEVEAPKKVIKTDLNANPQIRNRIDAQSRLSNFSKEIQKAISSNKSLTTTTVLPEPSQNVLPQPHSVKSRLTLNKADSTTVTVNRTSFTSRKVNVKSRLGVQSNNIKDRLGRKSVFERVSTTNQTSSVFSRLGN